MKKLNTLAMTVLVSALAFTVSYVAAAEQTMTQEKAQIKKQEQTQGSQPMAQQKRANGRSMGPGGNAGQNEMPSFADFDLNNDGKITEAELNEVRTARITKRAQEGYQMKGLANASSFADIDTNNDSSISPEEFAVHQSTHRQ